jgi:hypothetical protein
MHSSQILVLHVQRVKAYDFNAPIMQLFKTAFAQRMMLFNRYAPRIAHVVADIKLHQ